METVYIGHDGSIDLQLHANSQPIDAEQMRAITNIALVIKGQRYRASEHPQEFDWVTLAAEAVVQFKLGGLISTPGTDLAAELIVYAPEYPNGIVWGTFSIKAQVI
jgi:hypothetical protein